MPCWVHVCDIKLPVSIACLTILPHVIEIVANAIINLVIIYYLDTNYERVALAFTCNHLILSRNTTIRDKNNMIEMIESLYVASEDDGMKKAIGPEVSWHGQAKPNGGRLKALVFERA